MKNTSTTVRRSTMRGADESAMPSRHRNAGRHRAGRDRRVRAALHGSARRAKIGRPLSRAAVDPPAASRGRPGARELEGGGRRVNQFRGQTEATMGIEVQTITCIPSQTASFTFQEAPQDWVVGLTLFRLDYGLEDYHWVETLSVSLEVNLPEQASATANQLDVTVQATLSDASGNTINISGSYAST